MRLTGAIDPGPVVERVGPLGFIWTWTIVPAVEDFYQWTFYADGLRPWSLPPARTTSGE